MMRPGASAATRPPLNPSCAVPIEINADIFNRSAYIENADLF
ncbi:hypothetical protein BURMUCGD1_0116 [Burkholderia multivorans CGD1]|nr:hypothetical protein BURMUCGD1_0116 [Burkholderia multivorans CGD1]